MSNHKHSAIVQVTDENFDEVVLASTLPVLAKFSADWCGPCRMMEPYVEFLARLYAGRALVVEVNTDSAPSASARYEVQGIPRLIAFNNGQAVPVEQGNDEGVRDLSDESRREYTGLGMPEFATLRVWVERMLFGASQEATSEALSFAVSAQAAMTHYQGLYETPEYGAFMAAWQPFADQFDQSIAAADQALAEGTIDGDAHRSLLSAADVCNDEAYDSEEIQALLVPYRVVASAAEAELSANLFAAVETAFR
jgi:thioredoxin 1